MILKMSDEIDGDFKTGEDGIGHEDETFIVGSGRQPGKGPEEINPNLAFASEVRSKIELYPRPQLLEELPSVITIGAIEDLYKELQEKVPQAISVLHTNAVSMIPTNFPAQLFVTNVVPALIDLPYSIIAKNNKFVAQLYFMSDNFQAYSGWKEPIIGYAMRMTAQYLQTKIVQNGGYLDQTQLTVVAEKILQAEWISYVDQPRDKDLAVSRIPELKAVAESIISKSEN